MHIDAVPNRGARPTYLLRESYRDGARVRKRTLANVSSLSDEQIDAMSVCDFTTANGRDYPLLGDRKNASSKEGKNG